MSNFVLDFDPFWTPFWTLWGSLLDIKIGPTYSMLFFAGTHVLILRACEARPKTAPRGTEMRPNPTQTLQGRWRRKTAPRGTKTHPRGLKIASREPQERFFFVALRFFLHFSFCTAIVFAVRFLMRCLHVASRSPQHRLKIASRSPQGSFKKASRL